MPPIADVIGAGVGRDGPYVLPAIPPVAGSIPCNDALLFEAPLIRRALAAALLRIPRVFTACSSSMLLTICVD